MPENVADAISDDWVRILEPFSQQAIDDACVDYLTKHARVKPTPAAIRNLALHNSRGEVTATGDREGLTFDERELLETKILPTARRWLKVPGLRQHGEKTLAYWGEK